MAKMLLLNPKARRKTRKAPSAAQIRARAAFAAMARARAGRSRPARRSAKRRGNPVASYRRRVASYRRRTARRRNPINMRGLFSMGSYVAPLKEAAIQGAGAVAMDVAFGYINRYLPASVQRVPGTVGVGDAVKAILTVAIGRVLARVTRSNLPTKAATGALTVQFRDITLALLPPSMQPSLGWYSPVQVTQMNARTGLTQRRNLGAFTNAGTPLLSGQMGAYTNAGTPLLSASRLRTSAMRR